MHHLCYVEIGYVPQCPHCDISLTYHKSTDQLKCHYCGYHEVPPNKVLIQRVRIRQVGTGTQRVEEIPQNLKKRVLYEWMLTRLLERCSREITLMN